MSVALVTSPNRVINNLAAFQLSSALRSAIEIDMFTAIGEGHQTPEALAVRCGVEARGARILADYLVIHRYLGKQGDGYTLSDEAKAYLDRRSPEYLGGPVEFVQAPFIRAQFDALTQCVRSGGSGLLLNLLGADHEMWVRFARVMAPQMADVARLLVPQIKQLLQPSGRPLRKILDVAAGHGMFGIAFAKEIPGCRVIAQDWASVLEVARENAEKQGVADRIGMLAGNILEVELSSDYDLVLAPNLLHHFDRETNILLLKKFRAALRPGGLVAIVEWAPNDDRISPTSHAAFALFMLATTPAGDAYTVSEVGGMLEAAGLKPVIACELGTQRLIAGAKPE